MSSNKTVVKGLRASQEFFDKCDLVAKAEGVDRNKLIVSVVTDYLEAYGWYERTILGVESENKFDLIKANLVEKVENDGN